MFDAAVVGSGAVGSWVAKELTEGGLTVALLEAGPDQALVTPPPSSQAVQRRARACRNQWRKYYVDDLENPYTTPPGRPFTWIRGRQVGGKLHTWARHAPRVSDEQLEGEGVADPRAWPIGHHHLAPHYEKIERRLGVHGRADGIPSVPDGIFLPPPPASRLERAVCARLRERLPELAVTPTRNVQHTAPGTLLPIEDARATGKLHLLADHVVAEVRVDPSSGRAAGLVAFDRLTKARRVVDARWVVLCASALESVRLLLNSRSPRHPQGIGAGSGVLGRYIMDHVQVVSHGPLSREDVQAALDFDGGTRALSAGAQLYVPSPARAVEGLLGGFGIQIGFIPLQQSWAANAFGEMLPRDYNRITLDPTVVDAWGIPAARIDCRHSDHEVHMTRAIRARISEIAAAAGLTEAPQPSWSSETQTAEGATLPGGAIHEAGGARMGRDARSSVVDDRCRVWECENLVVADAACFPSLPFQNPTLTMMAVAARACEALLRDARRTSG